MSLTKKFMDKVIAASPEVVIGKRYDYKALRVGQQMNIYQRDFEDMPWKLIVEAPIEFLDKKKEGRKRYWKYHWKNMEGRNQHGDYS